MAIEDNIFTFGTRSKLCGWVVVFEFRSVDEHDLRVQFRDVVASDNDHVVWPALAKELPWRFEELKELFNNVAFISLRNYTNHDKCGRDSAQP